MIPERWRRAVGYVWMGLVVALARIRSLWRTRRAKRDPERRRVAVGEVIVVYPEQQWQGERNTSVQAVIELVTRRMRRWNVAVRGTRRVERRLEGLSRTYLRIAVENGFEDDVVRAVRAAAWRQSLKRGRFGLLVVRSPLIVPAALPGAPGPIRFTGEYETAKAAVGAANLNGSGVTVLVVDVDRPDLTQLTRFGNRIEILDPGLGEIRNGHATLMTAVVADILPNARIKTLSIGEADGSTSSFSLLGALLAEHDAHVMIASIAAPEGTKEKDSRGRIAVFEATLQSRLYQRSRPPLFCPTGNHRPNGTEQLASLAVPARFASVIAIGAVTSTFARAPGSRHGEKWTGDPHCWWLAPGGSFGGADSEPLAHMGEEPQAGTSIANAIAGAMTADVIHRLEQTAAAPEPAVAAALRATKDGLALEAQSQVSLGLADALEAQHGGAVTFQALVEALHGMAHRELGERYDPSQHGCGLLRLS